MCRLLSRLALLIACAGFVLLSCMRGSAAAELRVGSDVSYAPLEFYGPPGQTVRGFDIDLAQAIGDKLGMTVRVQNHNFDDLIPSLQHGTFDMVMSAMSDTRKREGQVDFVDYLLAGSGMLVHAGNPKRVFTLGGLCGLTVDVQRGTSQEAALQAQSTACVKVGLGAIHILSFSTDDEAFRQFAAGKSDVHVTDYPVVAYLARTQGGGTAYTVAGRQFDEVPYGIAIAKKNAALRVRVQQALQALIADGTYDRLLQKWGLTQGALRSAPINAGTLFEH